MSRRGITQTTRIEIRPVSTELGHRYEWVLIAGNGAELAQGMTDFVRRTTARKSAQKARSIIGNSPIEHVGDWDVEDG